MSELLSAKPFSGLRVLSYSALAGLGTVAGAAIFLHLIGGGINFPAGVFFFVVGFFAGIKNFKPRLAA